MSITSMDLPDGGLMFSRIADRQSWIGWTDGGHIFSVVAMGSDAEQLAKLDALAHVLRVARNGIAADIAEAHQAAAADNARREPTLTELRDAASEMDVANTITENRLRRELSGVTA